MSAAATPRSPPAGLAPSSALQPTWEGFVGDTRDALVLFEATINGTLNRVVRRPHDRERAGLIKSGSIFIYEESASGIKRWTDGFTWSPSRILNNFLIYRELERPFPPGERKRAAKKLKGSSAARSGESMLPHQGSQDVTSSPATPHAPSLPLVKRENSSGNDEERSLVGSLTDSYPFKEDGLVKKTISVTVDGVHYGLVSYYNPKDVQQRRLQKPTDTDLGSIRPRPELIHQQNFRSPIEDMEEPSPIPYAVNNPVNNSRDFYPSSQAQYYPTPIYAQLPPTPPFYNIPPQQAQHYPQYQAQSPASAQSYRNPGQVPLISPPPMPQNYYQFQNQQQPPPQMHARASYNHSYSPYLAPCGFSQQDQYPQQPPMQGWPAGQVSEFNGSGHCPPGCTHLEHARHSYGHVKQEEQHSLYDGSRG